MNTDAIRYLSIVVDHDVSLQAMISAGNYNWANPNITADRFPVEGTGTKKFRTKLFDPGQFISSPDVAAAMQTEDFTPGGHIHGLAFAATFPEEQRKYPIACLGSSAEMSFGRHWVVCLDARNDGERNLNLYSRDDGWLRGWRFLGIQEVSGT
jgi:hypothetical protein